MLLKVMLFPRAINTGPYRFLLTLFKVEFNGKLVEMAQKERPYVRLSYTLLNCKAILYLLPGFKRQADILTEIQKQQNAISSD